jgi:putative PIN family toxin of toxin-antitoxin system
MKTDYFFVFDTNALISAHLIENSINDLAFRRAISIGTLAVSQSLITEFSEVIYRKKFDKYFPLTDSRQELIEKIETNSISFVPTEPVKDAPDADDNMLLELALACRASAIVTGDKPLLTLHPFRGISIVNAATFLNLF